MLYLILGSDCDFIYNGQTNPIRIKEHSQISNSPLRNIPLYLKKIFVIVIPLIELKNSWYRPQVTTILISKIVHINNIIISLIFRVAKNTLSNPYDIILSPLFIRIVNF